MIMFQLINFVKYKPNIFLIFSQKLNRVHNLKNGTYHIFELFSCWVGDEDQEKVGELNLKINQFDIAEICIPERTLVRIEK